MFFFSLTARLLQFLAQLKLMDYSLLVGIHDVERAEQEEVDSEDNEAEDDGESDGGGVGTPPDSPSNTLDSTKPLSPGEFDPSIDVYAIKSNDSKWKFWIPDTCASHWQNLKRKELPLLVDTRRFQ